MLRTDYERFKTVEGNITEISISDNDPICYLNIDGYHRWISILLETINDKNLQVGTKVRIYGELKELHERDSYERNNMPRRVFYLKGLRLTVLD